MVGQLHALSRFATADGREDLEYPLTAAWAVPAADVLGPLLGWAHPNLVYVHLRQDLATRLRGVHARRARGLPATPPGRVRGWAWRLALLGYAVACVGVFLDYWTQWTTDLDNVFFTLGWFVTVPGLLLTAIGSTVLGITLLVRGSGRCCPQRCWR